MYGSIVYSGTKYSISLLNHISESSCAYVCVPNWANNQHKNVKRIFNLNVKRYSVTFKTTLEREEKCSQVKIGGKILGAITFCKDVMVALLEREYRILQVVMVQS